MTPKAAIRVLSEDHRHRMIHQYDEPENRGTRCDICDALATLDAARPSGEDVERHRPDITTGVHRGPLPDESLTYACSECGMDWPCDAATLAKAARAVLDYDEKERWGGPHDWLASLIGYYAALDGREGDGT